MDFRSLLTLEPESGAAARDLVSQADGFGADLALLFASHHYGPEFLNLLGTIQEDLDVRNLIGCTADSVIGPDSEVERQPAAVLWLAQLPNVRVLPFLFDQEDLERLDDAEPGAFPDRLGVSPADDPSFVVLADPFTFDISTALVRMDRAYPNRPKVGGMASGADRPGQNRLFLADQAIRHGMVGVALSGAVSIDTVVSQGCRPIADPFVVTKANANIIEELSGRKPIAVLREIFDGASPTDRELIQNSLHIGVVIDESLARFGSGDFLIRNILGSVKPSSLAINNAIRAGQTVQFHVRDHTIADEDMAVMLNTKNDQLPQHPSGGLLFSCNGRGRRMFNTPNHDIALVNTVFSGCAVAGFFAAGEIGPIGGRSFVHGLTSSLILFREP